MVYLSTHISAKQHLLWLLLGCNSELLERMNNYDWPLFGSGGDIMRIGILIFISNIIETNQYSEWVGGQNTNGRRGRREEVDGGELTWQRRVTRSLKRIGSFGGGEADLEEGVESNWGKLSNVDLFPTTGCFVLFMVESRSLPLSFWITRRRTCCCLEESKSSYFLNTKGNEWRFGLFGR